MQGEGAGAFLDPVLSCCQSSPVKQEFGSVKAVEGVDELLALPRLCVQPWVEVGTFSLDHQCLSTSDLALYHQELQFIYSTNNRKSFPAMRNKSFEIKLILGFVGLSLNEAASFFKFLSGLYRHISAKGRSLPQLVSADPAQ